MTLVLKDSQVTHTAQQVKGLLMPNTHSSSIFSHELCGHRNPSYLFTRRKVIFVLFLDIFLRFPCHGKTRLNGARQKGKNSWSFNESVTFTSTRTPTIHKKRQKKAGKDKPFLIIYVHHDIISPTSTFLHVLKNTVSRKDPNNLSFSTLKYPIPTSKLLSQS